MYLNRMIVRLLDDQGFIEEEEKEDTLNELEKTSKPRQSDGKLKKKSQEILNHPLGAIGVIFLYSSLKSILNKLKLQDSNLSLEERFKLKFKEDTYNEILREME